MYVGYNKKKYFVGYLVSLKFLAILSIAGHFGFIYIFYDPKILYDVLTTTILSERQTSASLTLDTSRAHALNLCVFVDWVLSQSHINDSQSTHQNY